MRKAPPSFVQSNLFGGQGSVSIWNMLQDRKAPPFSAALWCELEPHGSVGPHRQQRDPEVVICLGGEGLARVDDQTHSLEAGVMVYLPHGSTLALINSGDQPLAYLIIKASL